MLWIFILLIIDGLLLKKANLCPIFGCLIFLTCISLYLQAYEMRNAGAVIHSHGIESCLATMINPQAKEFRVSFFVGNY